MPVSAKELMKGAVDMHLHIAPSTHGPSLMDAFECAEQAGAAGMRAVVFKDQYSYTTDRAYLANKYGQGVAESIGGIALNMSVGGINKWAVIEAIKAGGKVIWMPAIDARNYVKQMTNRPVRAERRLVYPTEEEAVYILDKNDDLIPEIYPVLELIKENDIVLNTGHLSVKESLKLLKTAKETGIKKLVVDHPLSLNIGASMEDMEEMVSYGAYLENTFTKMLPGNERLDPKDYAKVIKTFGAENCIMSTDSGFNSNPPPVESMRLFIDLMRSNGVTDDEIVTMIKVNPYKLLNIK